MPTFFNLSRRKKWIVSTQIKPTWSLASGTPGMHGGHFWHARDDAWRYCHAAWKKKRRFYHHLWTITNSQQQTGSQSIEFNSNRGIWHTPHMRRICQPLQHHHKYQENCISRKGLFGKWHSPLTAYFTHGILRSRHFSQNLRSWHSPLMAFSTHGIFRSPPKAEVFSHPSDKKTDPWLQHHHKYQENCISRRTCWKVTISYPKAVV